MARKGRDTPEGARLISAELGYPYSLILRFGSEVPTKADFLFVYRAKLKLSSVGQRFQSLRYVAEILSDFVGTEVLRRSADDGGVLRIQFVDGPQLAIYPSVKVSVKEIAKDDPAPPLSSLAWELQGADGVSLIAVEL